MIFSRELSFVPARRKVFEAHDAQTLALIRRLAELERLPHGETVGKLLGHWKWLEAMKGPAEKQRWLEPLIATVSRNPEAHEHVVIFLMLVFEPVRRSVSEDFFAHDPVREARELAVGRLPSAQRKVIDSYFFSDRQVPDIAARRRVSESTVYNQKTRAQDTLKHDDVFFSALYSVAAGARSRTGAEAHRDLSRRRAARRPALGPDRQRGLKESSEPCWPDLLDCQQLCVLGADARTATPPTPSLGSQYEHMSDGGAQLAPYWYLHSCHSDAAFARTSRATRRRGRRAAARSSSHPLSNAVAMTVGSLDAP